MLHGRLAAGARSTLPVTIMPEPDSSSRTTPVVPPPTETIEIDVWRRVPGFAIGSSFDDRTLGHMLDLLSRADGTRGNRPLASPHEPRRVDASRSSQAGTELAQTSNDSRSERGQDGGSRLVHFLRAAIVRPWFHSCMESLPDEIATLRAELVLARAKTAADAATIARQNLEIAKRKRQIYGPRSERSAH